MSYKKNFLNQVIFQANFNIIEALKISISEELKEVCKEATQVGNINIVERDGINVTIQQNTNSTYTQKIKTWEFPGNNYRIQIQNNILIITALHYTNFQDFNGCIAKVLESLNKTYNPFITRLAIRYVNKISFNEGNAINFDNLINEALVHPTKNFFDKDLTRSIGSMSLKDDNDINVNFTYGFWNPQFPNKITQRAFLLDYDCFLMPNCNSGNFGLNINLLRAKANNLFEKSISEGLREIMNKD
jgi:uncharacterized protein (TIGR04255 family)